MPSMWEYDIISIEVKVMENTQTNGNKNGAKPRWERPKEPESYTKSELQLIKTTKEVLKIIGELKKEGAFDEFLEQERSAT